MMMTSREQYVELFVATRRTERALRRAEEQWQRWLSRVTLADRLGKTELAMLARQQALAGAEAVIALNRTLTGQQLELQRLEADVLPGWINNRR